ncbi:hypothetical protein ACFWDI_28425 [Streptomyces sp. NPDC060064]|uniref:hypothetical protein n=1 Tax=Streptomyces sp. NPDC060064 TaxID=3347049 RepID=UPI0036ADB66C
MPETPTTRLGLYKPLNDGSEFVSVQTDLNQNLDRIDLATGFQIVTSSTRPAAPYSGKPIAESDTGRLYYSNGSAPASASWIEIASNGAAFTMTGTKDITLNGTSNATEKLAFLVSGDSVNRLSMTSDGTMNWGPGSGAADVSLARTGTSTLGTASGDHFKVGGDLKLVNGATTYRNALATGPTTVANTVTETIIATGTIPADDAVAGAVYRITAYGVASTTGTPNFTLTARLGGVAGTTMGAIGPGATATGISGRPWRADFYLRVVSSGASASWSPHLAVFHCLGTGTQTGTLASPNSIANQTLDSTVSRAMVLTWTWGTASASNTATCTACVFERVA